MQERLLDNHAHLYSTQEHMKLFYASLFWNSFHPLADHNSKYYFNPYTLKLSPISSDQEIFTSLKEGFIDSVKNYDFNLNYKQVFKFSLLEESYDDSLQEIINGMENVEIYLNEFSEIFPLDEPKDASVVQKNQEIVTNNKDDLLENLKTISENKYRYSNDIVISDKQTKDLLDFIHVRHFVDGSLEFFNFVAI